MLHRDLLLPSGFLNTSEENVPDSDSGKSSKPKTRSQKRGELFRDEQSDSEDEICIFSRIPAGETRITYEYGDKSKEIERKEKEFPLNVRNSDNVCPQDERFGEVIEMNEPTDSEAQETVPTGNELEEGYVPSSDPIGDE